MQNLTLTPRYRLPGGFMIDGATLLRVLLLLALFAMLLWGNDAFAQAKLPTGDKLAIPGTNDGDSWAKKNCLCHRFYHCTDGSGWSRQGAR